MSPLRERLLPLTAALTGAASAIAYVAASAWMPHAVAVLAAMATGALLTGARGERAFAAMCDATGWRARDATSVDAPQVAPQVASQVAPRHAQADAHTRLGAAGATGIALLVVARLELLSTIDPGWIAAALVGTAAVSRGLAAATVVGMASSHPRLRILDLIVPLTLGGLPLVAIALWSGELATIYKACAVALLATAFARRFARRRLAHARTTALAAIAQVVEIAFLVGLLATLPVPIGPDSET